MPTTAPQNCTFGFLDRTQLIRLKLKAMRSGVWFSALRRIDRVLIDLTIKVTSTIRSVSLAKSIYSITSRLEGLLESRLVRAVREIGFPLACKLGLFAQKWGNTSAKSWACDSSFASFLAVLQMNDPKNFRS